MSDTIRYEAVDSDYSGVVVKSKITHLIKNADGKTVDIHLDNGEVLRSYDSLNTLQARLDSED